MIRRPPRSTLFPYRRSSDLDQRADKEPEVARTVVHAHRGRVPVLRHTTAMGVDRKSTRLNSSHTVISYAVFCLKKKKKTTKTKNTRQQKCKLKSITSMCHTS